MSVERTAMLEAQLQRDSLLRIKLEARIVLLEVALDACSITLKAVIADTTSALADLEKLCDGKNVAAECACRSVDKAQDRARMTLGRYFPIKKEVAK